MEKTREWLGLVDCTQGHLVSSATPRWERGEREGETETEREIVIWRVYSRAQVCFHVPRVREIRGEREGVYLRAQDYSNVHGVRKDCEGEREREKRYPCKYSPITICSNTPTVLVCTTVSFNNY